MSRLVKRCISVFIVIAILVAAESCAKPKQVKHEPGRNGPIMETPPSEIANQSIHKLLSRFVAFGADIQDNMAYFIAKNNSNPRVDELFIVDIGNLKSPTVVREFGLGKKAYAIKAKDKYVYIASEKGLIIVNAGKFSFAETFKPDVEITDLEIQGNLLYLTGPKIGLEIDNIENPEKPVKIGNVTRKGYDFPKAKVEIDANSDYAFIGFSPGIVDAFNIRDITNPVFDERINLPSSITPLNVSGYLLFAGDAFWGSEGMNFYVIDVSQPSHLDFKKTIRLPEGAGIVSSNDDYVFIGSKSGSLFVLDMDNDYILKYFPNTGLKEISGVYSNKNYVIIMGKEGYKILTKEEIGRMKAVNSSIPPAEYDR